MRYVKNAPIKIVTLVSLCKIAWFNGLLESVVSCVNVVAWTTRGIYAFCARLHILDKE